MNKFNALVYAAFIGFGLAAGVHIYLAWSILLKAILNFIKTAVLNA